MKIINKIKLNRLADRNLDHREMHNLRGGSDCICGCRYSNSGGSSTAGNGGANNSTGASSGGGGTWYP
jgi:natural product precursor